MSTSQPESPKDPGPNRPDATVPTAQARAEQSDRLAAALRDNLKRRKQQARARREPTPGRHEG